MVEAAAVHVVAAVHMAAASVLLPCMAAVAATVLHRTCLAAGMSLQALFYIGVVANIFPDTEVATVDAAVATTHTEISFSACSQSL